MAVAQRMSEQAYQEFVLSGVEGAWELHDGVLVEKPAIFSNPLPLVVEVWSRSTGNYDVNAKLPVYMQRDDLEIWRLHPYERTLTHWVRQPDGSYQETVHRGGIVALAALPGVIINLDELFDI